MKATRFVTISVKMPQELYAELAIRIPEGERSDFIRDAVIEKLKDMPRPDRVLALEQRIRDLEGEISEIKGILSDLNLLTYGGSKVNPYAFCLDDVDRKIVDYLIHYKGATTPELAEAVGVNRWMILNRIKRMQRNSRRQLGREGITYFAGKKLGKRKAWWLSEELAGEES